MKLLNSFQPKPNLTDQEISHGLRMMIWEGMTSNGFTSITTSGFLAAYALALGADNFQIGILAALPFFMQLIQIPAVFLIEKTRKRKIIAVVSWFFAQLLWLPVALIPVFVKLPGTAVSILVSLIAFRGVMSAITNCSWNSWTRDLVPQNILGKFYSRRLSYSTASAAAFGLVAAFFVDYYRNNINTTNDILGYTWILLFGAVFLGLASPVFMARMPEPLMQANGSENHPVWKKIVLPFRQSNFRRLMLFLLYWGFALNLAVPFFAIYMLQRLQMPLLSVIALAVVSQISNIVFLRVWGSLADRYGSKVILSLCASLYVLVILGWTFTTMPEKYFLTTPLLILLHIFSGMAAAGVTLTVGTLSMKLAPEGQATPYLTGASLATNLGAGVGPLMGGYLAKFFSDHELTLDFSWAGAGQSINLGVLHFTGFDFLFAIAFVIGLIALNGLTGVKEEGEVKREVVLGELLAQSRGASQSISLSPIMGLTNLFPMVYLKKVPGFDVAIGVTAYQLAETTRNIVKKAAQGRDFSNKVIRSLEKQLVQIWKNNKEIPSHTKDFTEQAAEGAMQAAVESSKDTVNLIRPAVLGITGAMSETASNPVDIVQGLSEGVIKGVAGSGEDLTYSVNEILESIRDAAIKLGLDEKKANELATQTVLSILHDVDPETENKMRQSISSNT
jgi:MFS family permease